MSFRIKLLLAMMLVVGAVTAGTLLATQRKVQSAYEQMFNEQFESQITYFNRVQEERLRNIREKSLAFCTSVRVLAALDEYSRNKDQDSIDEVYLTLNAELETRVIFTPFKYILDESGHILRSEKAEARPDRGFRSGPRGERRGGPPRRRPKDLELQLETLAAAIKGKEQQQIGYLAPPTDADQGQLHEVILTKIIDPVENDRVLGALVLGFPVSPDTEKSLSRMSQIQSGILLDGEIYSTFRTIPDRNKPVIVEAVTKALGDAKPTEIRFDLHLDGLPHTIFLRSLNIDSDFPPAYQVCVYSLDEPLRVQRELRGQILLFGGLAMAAALAVSLVLSQGLSAPMNELVRGTHEVEKGNFDVRVPVRSRDEIGALAQSFNQMTEGLALKEKLRSVLNLVTDEKIATDLMSGKIALGGEEREISVLFCDIRGFTPMTQNMSPPEVIQMLNEHFTPLTKVVYEHHGVVDKFVGDMIMAIFGAPTSHGKDPLLAAQCALRMIEEREKLNENSKYKISIGIGVASGKALAGRMGSADRLNYTVLGPRVNLGSRLCSQAGRMEVVIDETTYNACKDIAVVVPLPETRLKGFSEPIHAFKLCGFKST